MKLYDRFLEFRESYFALNNLKTETKEIKFWDEVLNIENYRNMPIDTWTMPTSKYYSLIDMINEQAERSKKKESKPLAV